VEARSNEVSTAGETNGRKASVIRIAAIFFLFLGVSILWGWTPLNEWISFEMVVDWQQSVKNHPAAFYLIVGCYLLGSLILFPVTILNIATVFTFGPIVGNAYALAGWLASAAMGYGIGRGIGREMVQKLARSWLDRLMRPTGRHGFLAVLTMRVFPVAPFTVVNFFVGAWGIRFRDFFLASVIGRIPGIVLLSLAAVEAESIWRKPGAMSIILLGLTLVLIPLATGWLCKRVALNPQRQRNSVES
jgi:phospholipase D1/2